jgi:hypothetical protein
MVDILGFFEECFLTLSSLTFSSVALSISTGTIISKDDLEYEDVKGK